jgi:hypothetical protein
MGWHSVLYARLGPRARVRQDNASSGKARTMTIWILSILLGIETVLLLFVIFVLAVISEDMEELEKHGRVYRDKIS